MKIELNLFFMSRLRSRVIEFLILLLIMVPAVLWAAPSLLVDDGSGSDEGAAKDLPSSDVLLYSLNLELMQQLWLGEADRLNLPVNGQNVEFRKTRKIIRDRNITWEGVDASGHVRVLLTLGKDHVYGRIIGEFGTMALGPDSVRGVSAAAASVAEGSASRVGVRQLDPEKEVEFGDDYLVPPQAAASEQQIQQAAIASEDGSRIDVMVLYTNGMAAAHPGDQINTRIQYLVDLGNQSFSNSGINTRFNLVHAQKVVYPDDSSGDMPEALYSLTDNTGVFSGVEELRTRYGADQVVLLRQYVDEGCGLAWILQGYSADARNAYAVVQDGSKTDGSGYYCSELSYVHEIGHNFGCNHDRANSNSSGRYEYSYGYQSPAENFRTVMAYNCSGGCPRVAHFSNPDVQYQGEATGVLYTAANSADNVRTINQTRIEMANYRAAVINDKTGTGYLSGIFLLLLDH
ncbi:MAG: hypothetical protein D3922_08330 [Candidatus Electrothrix sp. AR1]|nr:hypothetical protein [Candidatus Electrothrix sp. AR1]